MPQANPALSHHRCPCRSFRAALPELNMAFQPIVNVHTGRTLGYEALVRGPQGQDAAWVFRQILPGQEYALDQACRTLAIRTAARLRLSGRLSINFLPGAVYEPQACLQQTLRAARDSAFPLNRLMFEVVEHEQVPDPPHVRAIIDQEFPGGTRYPPERCRSRPYTDFYRSAQHFCAYLFPAPRTTRHPASLAFPLFDPQMLVSGLFRLSRACHGQQFSSGRNGENDVLTDVSPSPRPHDVV